MHRDALPRDTAQDHAFLDGQREATYGAPYPTGWYRILDSGELKAGQAKAVDLLGRNLVAFRTESGTVAVMDAHCPHQGASLAAGPVVGETIRCPFHAWSFGTDGQLAAIPGLDRIPRTGVCSHPVVERHGMIWMFHHVSGERVDAPYTPGEVAPIVDKGMTHRGRHDAGVVHMHLSEFVENSVDFQHFQHVHQHLTVPWSTKTIPGGGVLHDPRWYVDDDLAHVAYFEDTSTVTWRGKPLESSTSLARVTLFGPGGLVWFHFMIPSLGEVVLFQTHQPVGPLEQRVVFHWFAEPKVSSFWAWVTVGQWIANWKADLQIWQNKVFRPKPVLVSLDGPVREMRRWYAQFVDPVVPEEEASAAK